MYNKKTNDKTYTHIAQGTGLLEKKTIQKALDSLSLRESYVKMKSTPQVLHPNNIRK